MKRLRLALIGLILTAAPQAYAASLYEMVRETMDRQLRSETVDDEVAAFIEAVAKEREWGITADEVESIVGGSTDVCSKHEKLNGLGCLDVLREIRQLVIYENDVRLAGRHLQAIATGYELPISEIPRASPPLSVDMGGVVNIWKAGASGELGAEGNAQKLYRLKDEDVGGAVGSLAQALDSLGAEEMIAAVWRYQYGARLVRGQRQPSFPAPDVYAEGCEGTERQFLCKRWEEVEQALDAVWTALPRTFDPPLGQNEFVYFQFDEETLGRLPDNVIVWARMDASSAHPIGDIGLQWEYGFEPVLPSLVTEDSEYIPGGTYPPEPPVKVEQNTKIRLENERNGIPPEQLGSGLCSMTSAAKGYLCRPVETASAADCPEEEEGDGGAITLVSCAFRTPLRQTIAGPDVCREFAWNETQNGSGGSSSSIAPSCGCKYEVTCQTGECGPGAGGTTHGKDANGVIHVCVSTDKSLMSPEDMLAHEMVHVRQRCLLSEEQLNSFLTADTCCNIEQEAYLVNCRAAQERGMLSGLGISVEKCAAMLSNRSCGDYGENHCIDVTEKEQDDLSKALEMPDDGKCPVEESGEEKELNMCPCNPSTLSSYDNTIGNNLCFIGQCVEQSLDLHRVTPGRVPAGVQDGAYPFDDPFAGSPLGNFLAAPTDGRPILPAYRPLLAVHEFETALCALAGLPTTTPSALCAIAAERSALSTPLGDPLSTILNSFRMESGERTSLSDFRLLAQSVGTRIGTDLYSRNLRVMSKSLSEVLGTATKLLNEVKDIDFPTEMCPTGPAE